MAVEHLPTALGITRLSWRQRRQALRFRSAFGSQSVEPSSPIWEATLERGPMIESEAGPWMAFLMRIAGGTNQVAVWNKARPVPRGTMRGSMVLSAAAAAGATTLKISGGTDQIGATLVEGDFLGIGDGLTQQVVMTVGDAESDSETRSLSLDFTTQTYGVGYPGEITVSIQPPLRNAFAAGTVVTWNMPKALFRVQSDVLGWDYENVIASGFSLELLEDWRP